MQHAQNEKSDMLKIFNLDYSYMKTIDNLRRTQNLASCEPLIFFAGAMHSLVTDEG
jgi:hypothetical protein